MRNQPNKSKAVADMIKKNIEKTYSYRQDARLGSRKASFRFSEVLRFSEIHGMLFKSVALGMAEHKNLSMQISVFSKSCTMVKHSEAHKCANGIHLKFPEVIWCQHFFESVILVTLILLQ